MIKPVERVFANWRCRALDVDRPGETTVGQRRIMIEDMTKKTGSEASAWKRQLFDDAMDPRFTP